MTTAEAAWNSRALAWVLRYHDLPDVLFLLVVIIQLDHPLSTTKHFAISAGDQLLGRRLVRTDLLAYLVPVGRGETTHHD